MVIFRILIKKMSHSLILFHHVKGNVINKIIDLPLEKAFRGSVLHDNKIIKDYILLSYLHRPEFYRVQSG